MYLKDVFFGWGILAGNHEGVFQPAVVCRTLTIQFLVICYLKVKIDGTHTKMVGW